MIAWARRYVRAHPGRAALLATTGLVMAVAGFIWFEPHKLFIDERIDEGLPAAATRTSPAAPAASPSEEPAPPPSTLAQGSFRSLEHRTTGVARIVELPDGGLVLRFEGLDTSNGPDLRVYLSEIPAGDDWHAYGERFVDLGDLKANQGNQNYDIPRGTDLSAVRSAVIWCRRFEVGFGVAGLRVR